MSSICTLYMKMNLRKSSSGHQHRHRTRTKLNRSHRNRALCVQNLVRLRDHQLLVIARGSLHFNSTSTHHQSPRKLAPASRDISIIADYVPHLRQTAETGRKTPQASPLDPTFPGHFLKAKREWKKEKKRKATLASPQTPPQPKQTNATTSKPCRSRNPPLPALP